MRSKIILALGLVGLLAVGFVYAQSTSEIVKAKIDFAFIAGGKTLPAGDYVFRMDEMAPVFKIEGAGGKIAEAVNVITRLSGDLLKEPQAVSLVFDVVGDKNILSEIWIPGVDGYLIQATKGPHTHKVLKAER